MQNENENEKCDESIFNFLQKSCLQTPPSRRNLLLRAIRFFERIINAACILAYQFFATLSQENKCGSLSLTL